MFWICYCLQADREASDLREQLSRAAAFHMPFILCRIQQAYCSYVSQADREASDLREQLSRAAAYAAEQRDASIQASRTAQQVQVCDCFEAQQRIPLFTGAVECEATTKSTDVCLFHCL